ncbi:FecR family protein [Caulobacter soli]|uniref:FecR family protein n=1 Tax=Caulobacter soli TaxID=2708539 RepID=UPI0013EA7657|nr:FecR domain-containing protein [Caulobacter soli]
MTHSEDHTDLQALRREARERIVRFRSGEATADETAELLRWRARSDAHAQALVEAIRLRRLVAAIEVTRRAASGLAATPSARRTTMDRRVFLAGGAVAASAAGAAVMATHPPLGLWPSLAELGSDYRTEKGQRRGVSVAQGVAVELNTHTALGLDDGARGDLKLVSGEIAVDAERPVLVRVRGGEASAASGRFVLRLDGAEACVTCLAGLVKVRTDGGLAAALNAGQQLRFGGGRIGAPKVVDLAQVDAWRRGLLIFNDEPLSQVVGEINRYRPGRIVLADRRLAGIPVNAVFQLDRMDRALSQIREVANARVTTLPGGVVMLS